MSAGSDRLGRYAVLAFLIAGDVAVAVMGVVAWTHVPAVGALAIGCAVVSAGLVAAMALRSRGGHGGR